MNKDSSNLGLLALSKREILRYIIVVHQTIFPPLVTSLLFIFIFGLSVGKNIEIGTEGISYLRFMVPGLLAMHLISSSFENTSSSLFIARWNNHVQEILLSPLSYFEMVVGLLAGGVSRGLLTAIGVYAVATVFEVIPVAHPGLFLYFGITITVIFSCAGMMAALWANNFGMLSVWNTYLITPAVFLGGVFNPIEMLPEMIRPVAKLNPMYYLVDGMRYSVLGSSENPFALSAAVASVLAVAIFLFTVYLFKIGYKLRT